MKQSEKPLAMIRRRVILSRYGISNTAFYQRINSGLHTAGVSLGGQCVGWPSHEVDAIISARIAGKTDDEIRALVDQLHAARKEVVR